MPHPLEIRLFGSCDILLDGIAVTPLRLRKDMLLIALLTLRRGKVVDREFLASVFWSDSVQAQAYYNLRQTLVSLRKLFGTQAYRISTPTIRTVRLDLAGAYSDVEEFDRAVIDQDVTSLRRAITLYRGPLMQEYTEDWLVDARETRHTAYVKALSATANHCAENGTHAEAVQLMRHAVATDPWDESLHRGLMHSLAANGEIAAAMTVYRDLSDLLFRESNALPDPATKTLFEQIRSHKHVPPAASSHAVVTAPESSQGVVPALPLAVANILASRQAVSEPLAASPEIGSARAALAGGAVPLNSSHYLARREDDEFINALRSGEGIILIKGARQMGMTSLLARGLQNARREGAAVVHVDLETYSPEQMVAADSLCHAFAQDLSDQLDLDVTPEAIWGADYSPSRKLERYLRQQVLLPMEGRLIWAIDSVDALNGRDYSSSIFGLFRSWHNRRALDPEGPWQKLSLVLIYSTEAHLLIPDRHQSPFNVGYPVTLNDFTPEQIAELNARYGSPMAHGEQIASYFHLLSGHPYLSSLGLALLCNGGTALPDLIAESDSDEGPFGPHLRQMLADLRRNPELVAAVKCILNNETLVSSSDFYRLRTAGIVVGKSVQTATMRCELYRSYLSLQLQ
jgi:DNA-binding SARP family transcriptional activator